MKYFVVLFLLISGCSSVPLTPQFNSELTNTGYHGKYQYWQPKSNGRLSSAAKKVRNELQKHGAIVFYRYDIDSKGNVWNVKVDEVFPENILDNEKLIKSQLIYSKFSPTAANTERLPLHVTESMVFYKGSKRLAIPDDSQSREQVLSNYSDYNN